ncbi:hypothetical protein O4215_23675 [Rhodococcus maanshanensis]|uniref:ATP-binding protein n=1 Tax=Rhodococcus maanshanensis TaxID=183556 RepID=UPI0022B31B06|nr:hypothetical protein [Rhodococcus maanshanensis]MCZ4558563.1 hypothetical protein [Rhodococcus maanshanensis]
MGKTRLAIEVARRRRAADGPWMVDLGALTDGALMVPAVASALGLPGVGGAEHLAGVLAGRTMLMILDNCEHVVADAAALAVTLADLCPGVQLLATSREPLEVDGEALHEVPPLAPDEARDLFAAREGGVVPGWALGEANVASVRTICAELDGIPLGIELATAQLRVLSEQQIADGLEDRFTLLRCGSRSAPPRQRRLADTIDWSYRLLDDEQAVVLRQVAVFAGSFDIDGAAAVTGGSVCGRLGAAADRPRAPIAAHRPAGHRAALVSALAAGEAHCALGLAGGLYWFWYRMGRIGEGLGFLHAALAAVAADHLAPERRQFARATAGVASLTYLTGNRAAASDAARESAAAWAAACDRAEAARLSAWCGYFLSMDGSHDVGLELVRDSAATARALGSGFAEADARMVLGMLLRNHGRPLEAREELVTAIAIAERIGNRWSVGSSTWALMKSAMDAGDVEAAMSAARDMQSVLEEDGDVTSWLVLMHTAAAVLAGAGHPLEAAVLAGAVQTLGGRIGFLPEGMDPIDGPREAAAVRDALSAQDYALHSARGADLDRAQINALLSGLVGEKSRSRP